MHVPINVKSPINISEWQMGFNSAFKGLRVYGVILPFYSRFYCLVLNQAETFLNVRQPTVHRQWCPAITIRLLVLFLNRRVQNLI